MEKEFFEAFPHLDVSGELKELLLSVTVTRVTLSRSRGVLGVYIESGVWIHKDYVRSLEGLIKAQCFSDMDIEVRIYEKFHLSRQYTPKNLYAVYKDSIYKELKDYSVFLGNMLKNAKVTFPETNRMHIDLVDTVIARKRTEELVRILEKIFCERCNLPLAIETDFVEGDYSRYRLRAEHRIHEQVRSVMLHTSTGLDILREGGGDRMEGTEEVPAGDKEVPGTGGAPTQEISGTSAPKSAPVVAKRAPAAPAGKSHFRASGYGKGHKREGMRRFKSSDNPDLYFGSEFDSDTLPIDQITGEIGEVAIHGCVRDLDFHEIRNERTIMSFFVTDFTDTIKVKLFVENIHLDELKGSIKKNAFVRVLGRPSEDSFDKELTMSFVKGIMKASDFRTTRMDTAPEKRIELHCHTKMSDMDGVTDAARLVRRAYEWGHPAIAITDHGVVQAFPEANHVVEDIDDAYRAKYKETHPDATKEEMKRVSAPFKVIYGVEAYLVDDTKDIVSKSRGQSLDGDFVVFDIETTGFSPVADKIIEIGAVRVTGGKITDRYSTFVNPKVPIPFRIEKLTGIKDEMVIEARDIREVLPEFLAFAKGCVLVAHNASFDTSFIRTNAERLGLAYDFTAADTVAMARFLLPGLNRFKLDTVAKHLKIKLDNHHRAVDDAACTALIFQRFIEMLQKRGIDDLTALNEQGKASADTIRKLPSHHAIILARNETGRVNLYRLISQSHLNYYNRQPKLPKTLYKKYSDGLMIGSACEAGELYQAILRGESDEEITRLTQFYDYLEIQPLGNNMFMVKSEDISAVQSTLDLQEINKKIVRLAHRFNKPVVATCDVHFMDPEDEIYRKIIMSGKGFLDADEQAPLYLRTTDEMLAEFAYLGSETAEEVVIKAPAKIADMVEKISPIRAGKFPPVIEDSDSQLREICYSTAHKLYGEKLPEIVSERLERELHSIISNGYAVMYIIAQKLVWKSNEDGYLVGSRGSVGSSFVATMAGITEVNPLSPHYLCKSCHYVDFDSEDVKAFAGRAGCDMPDKICPVCGKPLAKLGFDIPFETFLGFKGNKEPDIDLNFSGEYQSKAHKYTEVIFGDGQTFRAGTIGTLADKTAYGYVKNYYEEHGMHKRNCEIDRIVEGCTGIRRSTGQHPGGIIVLPFGEDINSFTPVQHPANDNNTDIITTHFDYHSIDSNLLKLDILGHDDPTMIRMLEDLTHFDPLQIPFDEPKVMSLFQTTKALGITPDEIRGCPLGCLGVPEFGTDFVIQMLLDTKPQTFSDLIRISGLSHGTDVWLGNAQSLIEEGKATISTAICTRDDIMTYLIGKGLDSEESFTIMEGVRKGKGVKPDWEKTMLAHGVPEWYIASCKKIKYMFPKAHAAAYVMMAYRIAYYKIFYPLAYYAAYFSIRASAFSYELMCQGKERLEYYMDDYERRKDTLSKKEQDEYKDMKNVQEMYARGFTFAPLDLYTAQAHRFSIVGDKLMPSLDSIEGLGDKAADAVVLATRDGAFLSKDDFRVRTKVSKTVIDFMADLGLFGDLPETNQISLFDLAK